MNDYLNITLDNIDKEHICCAISDKKHIEGVNNKKEWMKKRIKEGHIFRKLNVQGKVFIEFAPLDTAWVPISGNKYMYIYCIWVAGSYKGHGYGEELLQYAINYARKNGYNGICTVSSKKKKPFLSEKSFFIKYNFNVVEIIDDYELLAMNFNDKYPSFNFKEMKIENKNLTIYYSPQCPFTINCIKEINECNYNVNFIKVDSLETAKKVPCIFNNWAVFKDGVFLNNTLLNKNSFMKLVGTKK